MLTIDDFHLEFIAQTDGWDWEVEGFIDKSGYVYPIDSDTKVISTVFERLASPVIRQVCKTRGYIVETANQTTYPDFTLTHSVTKHRIAIDIKTTYASARMGLTLGGYASFLRNNTKNILYNYSSYSEHWVLGFIYHQRGVFEEYDLDNMPRPGQIPCPYQIDTVFLRQKHDITGLRAGSGNTKNIGSVIVPHASDFATVQGPFTQFRLAREACDEYWRNYERLCSSIRSPFDLQNHPEFRRFGPDV